MKIELIIDRMKKLPDGAISLAAGSITIPNIASATTPSGPGIRGIYAGADLLPVEYSRCPGPLCVTGGHLKQTYPRHWRERLT